MNRIIKFAVSYPVSVLMLILGVCLLGAISYNKLGTDLLPDLHTPTLYIELEAGQRPAQEIERQFVDRLEAIATRQEGVTSVFSSSRTGKAYITVSYQWDQDMDMAYLDLQRAVSAFATSDEITSLEVSRYSANSDPMLQVAVVNENITDLNELRKVAENYMRNELVRLEGVADISLIGEQEAYIEIKTNEYLLDAYKLSATDIVNKIESVSESQLSGRIKHNDNSYVLKATSQIASLESIENLIVTFKSEKNENGRDIESPVYLKDIATITIQNLDPENIVRLNGKRCLGMNIYKESQYNTVMAVENVEEKLEDFQGNMPAYQFTIISNQGEYIESSIGEVKEAAVLGIILAMLILYLFLRRLRLTLIMSVAIPISIIATFNLMYFSGLSINIMTLGGLALGAGMLVDNAIVVMENIYRRMEKGLSPSEAAIKGTSEIAGAIISSTLTTIVVFLPIVYIKNEAGELFKEQAWTVTFSLVSSLFVAILVIPMLASLFVKPTHKDKSIQIKGIDRLTGHILKYRYAVVAIATVIMCATYATLPLIDKEFMPKEDDNEFSIVVNLPAGSQLEATNQAISSIEKYLKTQYNDQLTSIYTTVGPTTNYATVNQPLEAENQAEIKIQVSDSVKHEIPFIIDNLKDLFGKNEEIEIAFNDSKSMLSTLLNSGGDPLVVEIKGEDLDLLEKITNEITQKLNHIPNLHNIRNTIENGAPEMNLIIDRIKSGIYGIQPATVAQQVKNHLSGAEAGEFVEGGELISMIVKVPERGLEELEQLKIKSGDKEFRLAEIATFELTSAPKEILHNNQSRITRVSAAITNGEALSAITPKVQSIIDSISLPGQYSISITGEEQKRAESFDGLTFALILSVVLVYMVMASQFESLRHPFTILLTIPFAGVGSIIAFLIAGVSLNMMAFIGIIMLAGIAVNNSILLVDAANQLKAEGYALNEALMAATQQRIRPILMTTLTTILALLPMCFDFGQGTSLRAPMAVAVIGGLITSTLMTIIVIPSLYAIIDKKQHIK